MKTLKGLLENFFTHKDFLPPKEEIAGTLFTPLQIIFSVVVLSLVIFLAVVVAKRSEKHIRTVLAVLWGFFVIFEVVIILYEVYAGEVPQMEWAGNLSLYPCSIFLFAMPFAIWGKGKVRYAACGYVCSLGFVGGAVNFVYPANVLSNYSCISFAGFHTYSYHSAIIFTTLVMIILGYHAYHKAKKWEDLLLPSVPFLCLSVVANAVNFSPIDSDYMFFKLESFFFAPIGAATPDWFSVIIVYIAYLVIHALPYIPFFIINRKRERSNKKVPV